MSNYSAQGSITIKRLRNGDSLLISFNINKPLYQGVMDTGTVSPDWTVAANQPVIVPKVTSVMGNPVARNQHQWKWNGLLLQFSGATSADGNWKTDSTGKFMLNVSTGNEAGALKIVGNLASPSAVANGELEYTCVATLSGVNYTVTKSIDVVIQNMGASAYYGYIVTSESTLDSTNTSSTLKAGLRDANGEMTSFHVKWYKDDTAWTDKDGQKQITVDRDDINGTQLFIAEFYLSATDTSHVARAGVYVIDSLDEHMIVFDITSPAQTVAPGQNVTVKAKVVNAKTNAVETLTNASWKLDVMEKDTWTSIKQSTTDTITVTTAETDRNQKENDVEVVAEVEFS